MRLGNVLQAGLTPLRGVFPEVNPYGQAIENFFLQPSEQMAGRMAEGYPHAVIDTRAGRPLVNPAVIDTAGLIPFGTAAKGAGLLANLPPEFYGTVVPMLGASAGLGRLNRASPDNLTPAQAALMGTMASDPRMNVLMTGYNKIDYEKSQLPRKKVPKRLMELRSDIREKRQARRRTEPGDKLGKFPDIKARLEFFKQNKKRDAKLAEADKLITENPLWSKKFAEEIKNQFKTSSEFSNLTNAINKANLEAVPRALKKEGWSVRYGSEGRDKRKSSRYIVSPDGAYQIRLSDHDLPSTPDRDMRGVGWDDEIVLDGQQSPSDLIEAIKNRYKNPDFRWEDLGDE
jgi:hypothetical protein